MSALQVPSAESTPSEPELTTIRINKANHIKRSVLYGLGIARESLVQQFDKGLYLVRCDTPTLAKLKKEYRNLVKIINYWPKKPISKSWRRDQSHTAIVHITAECKTDTTLILQKDDYVDLRARLEMEISQHPNPDVRNCRICRTAHYQEGKKKKSTNSALRTFYVEFSTQVEVKTIIDNCVIDATEWVNKANQKCYLHIVQACAKEFAYDSKSKAAEPSPAIAPPAGGNIVPQAVYPQNAQQFMLQNLYLQQGLPAIGAHFMPPVDGAAAFHQQNFAPRMYHEPFQHAMQRPIEGDEDEPPPLLEDSPDSD